MKTNLLWALLLAGATACTQQTDSKTMPQATTAATGTVASRVQYKIVTLDQNERKYYGHYEVTISDFENKVNGSIAEGWQPVGGITFISYIPVQAMVKVK